VPGAGPGRRSGVDNWNRPAAARPPVEPEPSRRKRRRDDEFGDEPAYGPVLGFTAGWYAVPGVFYLIWVLTLSGDQRGFTSRDFVASLPWLFASIAMSVIVAALLRWATIGWRTLTLSFAAAVIGAGLVTIAHSLVG
jgi:hypothetical protein